MRLDGLSSLPNLEEFYASDNLISELTGLKANIALRTIDVSNNQIKELKGLTHLKQIEEVWASSNELSSFDEIEKELGDKPELKTVYFEGNPLQLNNAVNYRNKVRLCLPRVKQIDASKSKTKIVMFERCLKSIYSFRTNAAGGGWCFVDLT